jgi:VWFA-related protein
MSIPLPSPALVAIIAMTLPGLAIAQSADDSLARAHAALQDGDDAAAVQITTGMLEATPGDPRALLARSLAHYRLENLAAAEADLSDAMAGSESGGGSATGDIRWPDDFLTWVATVRAACAPDIELPDISIDDLNAAAAAHAVTAHFVMNVEVVRIPVIVENRVGGFIGGLEAADFSVLDGAGPATPVRELIPENEPTSIGILVDAGSPTSGETDIVVSVVSRLLEALQPADEIFIAQYSDTAEFLSDFSTDRIALAAAMSGYEPGKGRAMHDAIAMGLIHMRSAKHDKKALIVIASGDDEGSRTTAAEILLAARREGVAVHALLLLPEAQRWRPTFAATETEMAASAGEQAVATSAPSANASPTGEVAAGQAGVLQEIAHNTGGLVALRPAVQGQFEGFAHWAALACRDLSDYINNQYLILFRSTRPPARGIWRDLRVEVGPPHQRIRARSGYVR